MKLQTLDYALAHSKRTRKSHETAYELYKSYLKYGGVDIRSSNLNVSLGCSDDHCYVLVGDRLHGDRLYLFTPRNAYVVGIAAEKLYFSIKGIREEYRDRFIAYMSMQFPEITLGFGETSPIIAENLKVYGAVQLFCERRDKALLA